jgi:two-component sensor histidine kinase
MPSTLHPGTALQDILFHELHHRFYNSLQLVSAEVGILASAQRRPDEIRALRDRIALLGGLHRTLARPLADLAEMRNAFAGLCTTLTRGFARGTVTLSVDAMIFPEDPMVVRGLTLILVELVTNALKHGASNDAPVRVVIDSDLGCFRLSVANDTGSTGGAERSAPYVASRFAEALGGTLTVAQAPEHFVRVTVPIPCS